MSILFHSHQKCLQMLVEFLKTRGLCGAVPDLFLSPAYAIRTKSRWRLEQAIKPSTPPSQQPSSCRKYFTGSSTFSQDTTDYSYRLLSDIDIYIYSILGVAQYTNVTVRYVPWFGGHGSIWFRYNNKKKNLLCSVSFHLFWTESSTVLILNIILNYIYIYIYIYINNLQ